MDSRFKFCALIFGGEKRRFDRTECAFFLHDTKVIHDEDRCFPLTPDDFTRVNPNTGTAPVFRTRRDAEITRRIYEQHPVLVDHSGGAERKAWPVKYATMFHMANDSHLFRTVAQLEAEGFYPVEGNRWKRGEELYLPLYEGKMVQAFDHRAASVVVNPANLFRPGQPKKTLYEEHQDPSFTPSPRYWINQQENSATQSFEWMLCFKDITASTNVRTMIASIVPQVGCGHKLPLLLPYEGGFSSLDAACILANLNSFAFDYVTRQKVQATNVTWYIVEQLPIITPADYDRAFGATPARDLVRDHVLRLTYTAHDMQPPSPGTSATTARHSSGAKKNAATCAPASTRSTSISTASPRKTRSTCWNTFPIVRREDKAAFGRYRTRDLILAYMNALSAGDPEIQVAV